MDEEVFRLLDHKCPNLMEESLILTASQKGVIAALQVDTSS